MSKTTRTTTTSKHTARPANWVDKLISDSHAASTIRVGMTVLHLYPRSARPSNRQEAATVKGELIEAINETGLHPKRTARAMAVIATGGSAVIRNVRDRGGRVPKLRKR